MAQKTARNLAHHELESMVSMMMMIMTMMIIIIIVVVVITIIVIIIIIVVITRQLVTGCHQCQHATSAPSSSPCLRSYMQPEYHPGCISVVQTTP